MPLVSAATSGSSDTNTARPSSSITGDRLAQAPSIGWPNSSWPMNVTPVTGNVLPFQIQTSSSELCIPPMSWSPRDRKATVVPSPFTEPFQLSAFCVPLLSSSRLTT